MRRAMLPAMVIVLRGQLLGARGAFLKGLVAIALEHQAAARQMSISGIMRSRLSPFSTQSRPKMYIGFGFVVCPVRFGETEREINMHDSKGSLD